jgi:hypothetical protein
MNDILLFVDSLKHCKPNEERSYIKPQIEDMGQRQLQKQSQQQCNMMVACPLRVQQLVACELLALF